MGRLLALWIVVAVVLAVACSSSGNGGGGSAGLTCPAGFDAGGSGGSGSTGGPFAISEGAGHCSNLLNGTGANGAACKQYSDCMPTCCACPGGSSRSATVVFCNNGTCLVGADVCCSWIDPSEGPDGGGTPYECTH